MSQSTQAAVTSTQLRRLSQPRSSLPGWRLQAGDQGPCRSGVWGGPASWFTDGCVQSVSTHGRRSSGALWALSCKGTNLGHDLSKAALPNITSVIINIWVRGGGQKHSVYRIFPIPSLLISSTCLSKYGKLCNSVC